MLIKEVPKDAELTIEVSAAARKLEFKSQCIDTGMNYLYARPIIIDGKRVSHKAYGFICIFKYKSNWRFINLYVFISHE